MTIQIFSVTLPEDKLREFNEVWDGVMTFYKLKLFVVVKKHKNDDGTATMQLIPNDRYSEKVVNDIFSKEGIMTRAGFHASTGSINATQSIKLYAKPGNARFVKFLLENVQDNIPSGGKVTQRNGSFTFTSTGPALVELLKNTLERGQLVEVG